LVLFLTEAQLGVAFMGMMSQIPLILLTDPLRKVESHAWKVFGNMVFWISFCLVGQPLAALLYFFAWQAKYGSASKPSFHMFEKKW
jgi:diacylglycerol O-acyltransferase 1